MFFGHLLSRRSAPSTHAIAWAGRNAAGSSRISRSAGTSAAVEEHVNALRLAEYQATRAESIQSFTNAQSIIQWSLASYGVLFGGGLVVIASDTPSGYRSTVDTLILVVYALLVPALVCAGAWSWLGEITRMERVGVYQRGLEEHLRDSTSGAGVGPLHWETYLRGNEKDSAPSLKRIAPYVGTAFMFFASIASSFVFTVFWAIQLLGDGGSPFWTILTVCFSGAAVLAFLIVCGLLGNQVVRLGDQKYDFEKRRLVEVSTLRA